MGLRQNTFKLYQQNWTPKKGEIHYNCYNMVKNLNLHRHIAIIVNFLRGNWLFLKISEKKTQLLKEKTQNSRQKIMVSAKWKTRLAKITTEKKPDLEMNLSYY